MHVFSNHFSSYFYVHKKRGKEAMQEMQILPHFKGRLFMIILNLILPIRANIFFAMRIT